MSKLIILLNMLFLISFTACQSSENETTDPAAVEDREDLFDREIPKELPYEIETLADNLRVPWAIDKASDGRIFFTERAGKVRVIENGELHTESVITLADTESRGEGGLLGLVLHPNFSQNHIFYVYQTYREGGETKNRVIRLIEQHNKAEIDKIIIDGLPGSTNHNGGRIKIGPDEKLYITAGDKYETELAQQLDSLGGKILRLELDGSIPADNPFPNSPIYSWGHRNPQGLVWHPHTGQLISTEHGQSAHDEINRIIAGGNYGWPLIEGEEIAEGMYAPIIHSGRETWAPSGAAFITKGPWEGELLVANLRGQQLLRLTLSVMSGPSSNDSQFAGSTIDELEVVEVNPYFKGEFGRIRDVYEATDGTVYFLTNNYDGRGSPQQGDDRIMMLVPKDPGLISILY